MKADLKTPKYVKNEVHCFVARAVFLQMGDIIPPKGTETIKGMVIASVQLWGMYRWLRRGYTCSFK